MVKRYTKSKSSSTDSQKNKQPAQVSKLFGKILPANYRAKSALIEQYQQFFKSLDSDAVFQMVSVNNVEADCLTLSLPSAALVNYLRLHSKQIQQQIEHQFGQMMEIKIISMPTGAQSQQAHNRIKPAAHFSAQVSDQIKQSAKNIDDDELMQSLIKLADAIRQKDN
jgi:hypothetical protein